MDTIKIQSRDLFVKVFHLDSWMILYGLLINTNIYVYNYSDHFKHTVPFLKIVHGEFTQEFWDK